MFLPSVADFNFYVTICMERIEELKQEAKE